MDITELLVAGVRRGASDLHLSAGLAPMWRIDGEVWPMDWPVLSAPQVADLLSPLLNQYQQKDFETSLETDFAFELPGVARFRAERIPTGSRHGRGVSHYSGRSPEPG